MVSLAHPTFGLLIISLGGRSRSAFALNYLSLGLLLLVCHRVLNWAHCCFLYICINDLPHAVSFCDVGQYADDTLISYSNPSFSILEARLQNDVNSIVNWLIANKLWINVSKTEAMVVGSRQRVGSQHLSVVIDNEPIHNVYVAKFLGVQIDQCLTWRNHVDYVLSKARRKWHCIKRLQRMSSYLFGLLYQVFIIPLFKPGAHWPKAGVCLAS